MAQSSRARSTRAPVFEPFAVLTETLILIPTPIAISIPTYRALYASLHADAGFCHSAFGDKFPPRQWTDEETIAVIQTYDVERSWYKRGLGDFAVGFREVPGSYAFGSQYKYEGRHMMIEKNEHFQTLAGPNCENLHKIQWVGYAGVRDATTTSLPPPNEGEEKLPEWDLMVELRIGIAREFWGQALGIRAGGTVLGWSSHEKDIRRYIAQVQKGNKWSANVLHRLGFIPNRWNHWHDPSVEEWDCLNWGTGPCCVM